MAVNQHSCKGCGKPLRDISTVNNNSNRFFHCSNCKRIYSTSTPGDSSQKYNVLKPTETFARRPPYPVEIASYLDKYVVGQHEAKKTLAVGIYSHYRRLANNAEQQQRIQQINPQMHQASAMNHPITYSHGYIPMNIMPTNSGHLEFPAESEFYDAI